METMERYSYSIHPFRTITDVIPGKGIRKPMTLKLTKEEVLKCMEKGPVYRAFPDRPYVRVTRSNLDSLHVSTLEDDFKPKTSNYTEIKEEGPQTETVVPEEPKNDTPTEVIEEEKQEKKKFPYAISKQVGNKVETDLIENEDQERRYYETEATEEVVESVEEDLVNEENEIVEEEESVEDEVTDGQPLQPINSNNYNKKKNKHRH